MKRDIGSAGRLLPLACGALLAACQAVSSPPSIDDIVAGHVAALGGLERLRAVQTLRETGRVTAGANRQALVTRERKRPARTRFEFTLQGVTGVFVSDGRRGWRMSPFEGDVEPQPLADAVVAEAAEQADIEGPLVDWRTKGHRVEFAGRETVDGRDTYRLKLTLKSGTVRYEYLDVASLARVRTETTRHVHGHPVRIEATFGDYRETDGVLFPHRIDVEAAGRPAGLHVVVDTIEINPPLADDRFELAADGG